MVKENKFFKMCKFLLLYGGIWTLDTPNWSRSKRVLYKMFSLTGQFIYVSCLPLFVTELFIVIDTDLQAVVDAMKGMTFILVIVCKMIIVQSKKIAILLESAYNQELEIIVSKNSRIKQIYRSQIKYCHVITSAVVFFLYATGFIYIGDGIYRSCYFYKTHSNITATTVKPHPVQLWFPFDKNSYYKTSMAYEIIHILQTMNYNGAAQALVSSVMVFLKTEFRILQHNIRNISLSRKRTNLNNTICISNLLKEYAMEHQGLIRKVQEFNASFQYIILLEYCVTSLTLAFILFDVFQGRKIAFNVVFFIVTALQFFILSWNANEILFESSSGLSDALYECPWYTLDKTSNTFIQIMLMRCTKPLTISIGPFGFLTLNSALSRMKLAYSVVSVLSTSTSKKT